MPARKRYGQFSAGGLMSDHAQGTQGIEMKLLQRTPRDLRAYVFRKRLRLAQCELRGGRTRLFGLCVNDCGTVTDRPDARVALRLTAEIHVKTAALICVVRHGFQR